MPVLSALSVTLEVPDLEPGLEFYTDAGMVAVSDGAAARLGCPGQERDSLVLIAGAPRKRLHHIALRADGLDEIAARVPEAGGKAVPAPEGFQDNGLWVEDPHGMLIHLSETAAAPELAEGPVFEVNGPGRVVRKRRSAMLPNAAYAPARPLRLGHILVFSPDVLKSVAFMTEALGMGLADRAQDVIAFCCAKKDSDHHVVAFAKSPGVGFHHASFQVSDPDEVGRGGRALVGDHPPGRHERRLGFRPPHHRLQLLPLHPGSLGLLVRVLLRHGPHRRLRPVDAHQL